MAEEAADCKDDVVALVDSVYDIHAMQVEDARKNNVELKINKDKLDSKEFRALWTKINAKSVYTVEFDESELINKAVTALNQELSCFKNIFQDRIWLNERYRIEGTFGEWHSNGTRGK